MTCHCSHTALCHQYRASTAANDGECLAPQCPCGGYESGESALGIRGNDVSAWDNGDVKREPDRANESDPLATVSTRPKGA